MRVTQNSAALCRVLCIVVMCIASGCSPLKPEQAQELGHPQLFARLRTEQAAANKWRGGVAGDSATESVMVIQNEIDRRFSNRSAEVRYAMRNGAPWIGMSRGELYMVMGMPNTIRRVRTEKATREEMLYPGLTGRGARVVLLENEEVVAIQD